MAKHSYTELKAICQPSEKVSTDPFLGRIIYRKFSLFFSYGFYLIGIPANFVSIIGLLIATIGAFMFLLSIEVKTHFLGALLIQLSIVIDYSDGEVSRIQRYNNLSKNTDSNISGMYVDNMMHYIIHPIVTFLFLFRFNKYFTNYQEIIIIVSFFASLASIGLPNLAVSEIIRTAIIRKQNLLNNKTIKALLLSPISDKVTSLKKRSGIAKIIAVVKLVFRELDVVGLITMEIITITFLHSMELTRVGIIFDCLFGFFLSVILITNFLKTFYRGVKFLEREA